MESPLREKPRSAVALGLVAGAAFVTLWYSTTADAPRSPGDWLWNGAISAIDSERVTAGGPLSDWLYRATGLADSDVATQRLPGLVADACTLFGLACLMLAHATSFLTPIGVLAACGLLPLAAHDPSDRSDRTARRCHERVGAGGVELRSITRRRTGNP